MVLDVALSGDSILTRRVSIVDDEQFKAVVDLLRDADVSYTHLETLIHDFERDDVFPAAEGAGTWLRSPPFVADELAWTGFDIVSHPSNHALDYAYGGLYETWEHLDAAGIPYAGTGETLADARSPTYVESTRARLALVSMTSSFTRWSRAGDQRPDIGGRPGVNPLRYEQVVSEETMDQITELGRQFGWFVTQIGENRWELTPPGIHNTAYTFVVDDADAPSTRAVDSDVAGNLRSIRDADAQSDLVVVHVHAHEFDPVEDIFSPPSFARKFAKRCIDAGADVFLLQGSHNVRGIEIYDGSPIFYDLGDLFLMHETVTHLPAEFYQKYEDIIDAHWAEATPSEAFDARSKTSYHDSLHPSPGYWATPGNGSIVPLCTFDDDLELETIRLHPCSRLEEPVVKQGLPTMAVGDTARDLLAHVAELSERYGTSMTIEEETAIVDLS